MLIWGFHAVTARLKRGGPGIVALHVAQRRGDGRMRELLALAGSVGVPVHAVEMARVEALCPGRRHQGVVLDVQAGAPLAASLEEVLEAHAQPFLLLLDGVTDPRNLGACLRVADGAGVHAVIAPKDHACPLTEAAVQTASGAAESVPYLMVGNLARTIDRLQEAGVMVIGAADASEASVFDASIPSAVAWALGAEGKGLRRLTRERCDALVSIPMAGQVSSLNVATAAAIVLYETVRRRLATATSAPR
jgi:23S rRNA (guanosine2251-2'-O)-methyltransferase